MLDLLRRHFNLIRMFFGVGSFLIALDASIALNRWWIEGDYLGNLFWMSFGFISFIVLSSRNKRQILGFTLLVIAVYYVCDYEIGGLAETYLTPFDPLFGRGPAFTASGSIGYRKLMAYVFSILSASVLTLSKIKNRGNK